MEYYIFRDDRIGRTIAEILMRKARAGVEVRVIYDAFGSRGLSRKALDRLRRAGAPGGLAASAAPGQEGEGQEE